MAEDLRAAALTAAAVAIHDADCPDTHCSGAALGHCYKLARAALEGAAPHLREQAAAAERAKIRQIIDPGKIEWMIHAFDLIDNLAASCGMDTSTEVQDDLRRLAGLLSD